MTKVKVLVIENEPETREMLLEYLELEGFEVIGAEDERTGLEKALQHLPDMAICNIMRSKLNGCENLKKLYKNTDLAMIPLIFLTKNEIFPEIEEGMKLGINNYLPLPFTPKELSKTILDTVNSTSAELKQQFENAY